MQSIREQLDLVPAMVADVPDLGGGEIRCCLVLPGAALALRVAQFGGAVSIG